MQWKDPPCFMGKSTISMAIFNCFLLVNKQIIPKTLILGLLSDCSIEWVPGYYPSFPAVTGCPNWCSAWIQVALVALVAAQRWGA